MKTVAVVDDDPSIRETLQEILSDEGYHVITAGSPGEFFAFRDCEIPPVVILDLYFGEGEPGGETVLRKLTESHPNTQVIVISGESQIQRTTTCLRDGALDFIEKPVSLPRLLTAVKNAFQIHQIREETLKGAAILGESRAIKMVMSRIRKLAALNESVLITGENGTGKELVAKNLHLFSPRYSESLVSLNCTALNPNLIESELFGHEAGSFTGAKGKSSGYFQRAHGSTLFIDEIGDFDLSLQSKILRVLQERTITPVGASREQEVDIRPLFATHRNLEEMVENGSFREDLFFRISTFTIALPPLRARSEDIPVLADHFLQQFIKDNNLPEMSFCNSALEKLAEYHFPGNIRELAKIVKNGAFFALSNEITAEDITFTRGRPESSLLEKTKGLSLNEAKKTLEREFIIHRLRECGDSIDSCAESLGIIKNNLYRKIRELSIEL